MKSIWTTVIAALAISASAEAQTSPEQSMDKPWEYLYENPGKTPHDNDQSERGKLLQTRWKSCSDMVLKTNMVAKTVADVKDNPDDYYVTEEQNRKQLERFFPTNTDTYQDTINEKILGLGYQHWEMGRGDADSSPELSQLVWDWCSSQAVDNFKGL